jgi:hypothetical protein
LERNKYNFQKLTPTNDVDLKVYEDAFEFIFQNNDINNVAISGPYSAGKSSVLESYKIKKNNIKYVHISLAHFKSPDQKDESEIIESILEGKIINQLIHQIPTKNIPQTNFKVKKKVEFLDIVLSTVLAIIFVISMLHIIFYEFWNNYRSTLPNIWMSSVLSISTNQYSLLVSSIISISIFGVFLYFLIYTQRM